MSFLFRNVTSGSIAANDTSVTLAPRFHCATKIAVDVRGTFSGTLAVEASIDGTNYTTVGVATSAAPGTIVTSFTTTGIWTGSLPLPLMARVRSTAWTSGTAVVTIVILPE